MEEITKEEYEQLKIFVCSLNTVSTAIIQSAFKWRFEKTFNALEILEKDGVVGPIMEDSQELYRNVLQYRQKIEKV